MKGFLGEQVPGRDEVQGQAHDAKVVLGGRWASRHYLLAYLCLLITVTVTYERALCVCVCEAEVTGHGGRVPRLPDMGLLGTR